MSKSAFGSSVQKFTNYGIHPKLQSYNTSSSTSSHYNIGPGSYDVKFQEKVSKNRFQSEMWKKQYNIEQQQKIPHFMIKEQNIANAEMKRRLGPGAYDIDVAINNLSKSIHSTTVLQSKAPRFKDEVKDCFPGPSTYGIPQEAIERANQQRKYSNSVGMLDRGGSFSRTAYITSNYLCPGIYNLESPVKKVLEHQTGKRGYYDCNSIDRSSPIKTGHYAILVTHNLGPGQYNFTNEIDRYQDKYHKFKGKFLREKQYPDKPYQKTFWSDPGNTPVDKENQVSPASYDITLSKKINKSKYGFGSSDIRMNKFAQANFMGENNPLTGPGRYNCDSKEMGDSGNGYESVFKSQVSKISDPRTSDVLRHRVRQLNIPEEQKQKCDHLATESSIRKFNNFHENLKSLVIS